MTTTSLPDPGSIRERIQRELPELIEIRHDLHAHPELGYEEVRTSGVIQRELAKAGVRFVPGLAGGTGVIAGLPGKNGPSVGLRADMDALPIHERAERAYQSTHDGKMHACGHDGHMTVLLGAMRVLAGIAKKQQLPRPVRFVFQPAEEGGAGGKRMVEDGCLGETELGPTVEKMFGLHGMPQAPLGTVMTRVGPLMAAADEFELAVTGTDSHAAFPHLGNDTVVAACAIVQAFQSIVSRDVDPVDSAVVSTTQIHGGSAHNVLPGIVTLGGTVRTLREETRQFVHRRLHEVAEQVARAHGCEAKLNYHFGYPVTANDGTAVAEFRTAATRCLGDERVLEAPFPIMGGEDFAFYGQHVPSCFFFLGLRPTEGTPPSNLHQDDFDFRDDALATGIEVFVQLALGAGVSNG